MHLLIWLPLVAASVFFLSSLIDLGGKSAKLSRQLNRLEKLRAQFKPNSRIVTLKAHSAELPDLKKALDDRKVLLKSRSKKREAKQRRLVSRLKNPQLNKRK